jgi:hypothetical protein
MLLNLRASGMFYLEPKFSFPAGANCGLLIGIAFSLLPVSNKKYSLPKSVSQFGIILQLFVTILLFDMDLFERYLP